MPEPHLFDTAISWIDAAARCLDTEVVPLPRAWGRVVSESMHASRPIPGVCRAALDGFAVEAAASLGASAYNPLRVPSVSVTAGDALPAGTDAVVPLQLAEPDGERNIEVVEAVAAGDNVEQAGTIATTGATLVPAGTRLAPRHIGLLRSAGVVEVPVVRRPQVSLLVARLAKGGAWEDSNGPMICAAAERDGGVIREYTSVERDQMELQAELVKTEADIVLVIGGTGPGRDDYSAAALGGAGELAIHGVALRPGETIGLGRTVSGVPIVLLPGTPAACFWSYELLGGRAIRRLAGRDAELPYRPRQMITARKIVSLLGMTEICPVRLSGADIIEPLPSFAEIGLMAAVDAHGFVIVPHGSEGYPQGARVIVYLYDDY